MCNGHAQVLLSQRVSARIHIVLSPTDSVAVARRETLTATLDFLFPITNHPCG